MTSTRSFAVIPTEEFLSSQGQLLQEVLHESLMPDQPKHYFLLCSEVDLSLGPWVSLLVKVPANGQPDIHVFLRHSDVALVFELTDQRTPLGFLDQGSGHELSA